MPDDGTLSQEQIAADTNRRVGELADAVAALERKVDELTEELRGFTAVTARSGRGTSLTDMVETVKNTVETADLEPFVRRVAGTWFARPTP